MFIVEGSKITLDFLCSDIDAVELLATPEWLNKNQPKLTGIQTHIINKKDLKKVSSLSTPPDVLSVFRIPEWYYNDPQLKTDSFCIALDDISDPGNLGTIIRTADWFGISEVFCSDTTVDAFNPKVVQATMGSLARVKVYSTNLKALLQSCPDNLPIYGALLDGQPVNELENPKSGIIMIGNESHGISKDLIPFINNKITIPMLNENQVSQPESLNASIATAIICYALKIRLQ